MQTDYPLIVTGAEVFLRYGISYWDGAIIAADEALWAKVLYTEDLSHGQRYGSVRAINPFGRRRRAAFLRVCRAGSERGAFGGDSVKFRPWSKLPVINFDYGRKFQ